ncbi:hypothetical protein BO94DRAFT_372773 [Aspergillus sclerotioniger CBS 115572]|uniref:Uncharacterized protein n=1 Tax=Aspergillus sclerotioniger CBS 115572 TaxID=1450535 RepID=A0A317X3Z4_9EURO|nr:hypothetical protein BO94DRAFT_372773 [Aspergillus sclerotioniger CBS 115572]PWY93354.1 hypothetical protein BO94DRAFT_372773 [Aspergillus sclerotioniger CBS 115572]
MGDLNWMSKGKNFFSPLILRVRIVFLFVHYLCIIGVVFLAHLRTKSPSYQSDFCGRKTWVPCLSWSSLNFCYIHVPKLRAPHLVIYSSPTASVNHSKGEVGRYGVFPTRFSFSQAYPPSLYNLRRDFCIQDTLRVEMATSAMESWLQCSGTPSILRRYCLIREGTTEYSLLVIGMLYCNDMAPYDCTSYPQANLSQQRSASFLR